MSNCYNAQFWGTSVAAEHRQVELHKKRGRIKRNRHGLIPIVFLNFPLKKSHFFSGLASNSPTFILKLADYRVRKRSNRQGFNHRQVLFLNSRTRIADNGYRYK